MQQKSNTAYKWRKIFAAKAYGGKEIKLTPIEAQELIDDIESEAEKILALFSVSGRSEQLTCPDCKTDDVFIWPKYNLNKCHQCLHEWAR